MDVKELRIKMIMIREYGMCSIIKLGKSRLYSYTNTLNRIIAEVDAEEKDADNVLRKAR